MIAIDPGLSGGIAWLAADDEICACAMPATESDIKQVLMAACLAGTRIALVEDVPLVIGQRISPASVGKLHRNYGFCLGVLSALSFRIELVKPRLWQSHFQLGTKRDTSGTTEWKNKLKAEAQRRFPYIDVTLATADALLLLDYGRRK